MSRIALTTLAAAVLILPACAARSGTGTPPSTPTPPAARTRALDVREGIATYYGPGFHGKTTASGVRYDMNAMVAAHPHYPFGTVVRVTHLRNGRSARVRIVDRGPAAGPRRTGVLIDLSQGVARRLDFIREGRARVRIEVLRWGARGT
jgi:rare lipoprotein A